jgi:hypothetical protein
MFQYQTREALRAFRSVASRVMAVKVIQGRFQNVRLYTGKTHGEVAL